MKLAAKPIIGCLFALAGVPLGLLFLLLAFGMFVGAKTHEDERRIANPQGDLWVIAREEAGGGAAGWTRQEVLIETRDGRRARVVLSGSGDHVRFNRWIDSRTISVCARGMPSRGAVSSADGSQVAIISDCSDNPGSAEPRPASS